MLLGLRKAIRPHPNPYTQKNKLKLDEKIAKLLCLATGLFLIFCAAHGVYVYWQSGHTYATVVKVEKMYITTEFGHMMYGETLGLRYQNKDGEDLKAQVKVTRKNLGELPDKGDEVFIQIRSDGTVVVPQVLKDLFSWIAEVLFGVAAIILSIIGKIPAGAPSKEPSVNQVAENAGLTDSSGIEQPDKMMRRIEVKFGPYKKVIYKETTKQAVRRSFALYVLGNVVFVVIFWLVFFKR